jgi:hypothetical protein
MTEPKHAAPTFSLPNRQRVIIALLLIVAVGGLVWAGMHTDQETPDVRTTGRTSAPVVAVVPKADDEVLRQAQVGVQLRPGYEGDLTIGGHVIPRDQLVGKGPKNEAPTPPEYIFYTPAPGQELERLPSGKVCAQVRYWRTSEGDAAAQNFNWCFEVT